MVVLRGRVGPRVEFAHAAQAVEAAAARHVEQHGLGQVVGSVAYGDQPGAHLPGHPAQELVTHVPGRLLEGADSVLALISGHVHFFDDAVRPHTPDEISVVVGFLTPEVVKQMSGLNFEVKASVATGAAEDVHQGAGIRSPRHAGHHHITRLQPGAARGGQGRGVQPHRRPESAIVAPFVAAHGVARPSNWCGWRG